MDNPTFTDAVPIKTKTVHLYPFIGDFPSQSCGNCRRWKVTKFPTSKSSKELSPSSVLVQTSGFGLIGPSGYDIHSLPWKDPPCIFNFGKPSISIRAIEKPWRTVSHNQRIYLTIRYPSSPRDPQVLVVSSCRLEIPCFEKSRCVYTGSSHKSEVPSKGRLSHLCVYKYIYICGV
jgi:hypothetical protein